MATVNVSTGLETQGTESLLTTGRPLIIRSSELRVAGVAIPLASNFVWGFTFGVRAQERSVPILMPFVEQIFKSTAPATLEMVCGEVGNPEAAIQQRWEKLVLFPSTAGDYAHDTFTLADRRWDWSRTLINASYNFVVKSGDFQVFGTRTIAQGANPLVVAERYYAPWSMRRDPTTNLLKPWKILDITLEILTHWLQIPVAEIDYSQAQDVELVPLNVVANGIPATQLLEQMLESAGNNLYIEKTGKVVLKKADRGADDLNAQPIAEALNVRLSGNLIITDNQSVRPSAISVHTEREEEVIFAYGEGTYAETVAATDEVAAAQLQARYIGIQNVTRTVVHNQIQGMPAGSWISVEQALSAFGSKFGSPNSRVTLDDIRTSYGERSVPVALRNALATGPGTGLLDPLAPVILNQIYNDYRRTFKVPADVIRRIKRLLPVRADVLNPIDGTRQPAEVFSTLTWVLDAQVAINGPLQLTAVLDSFSQSPYFPTAADVRVVDEALGIIQLTLRDDLSRPGYLREPVPGELLNADSHSDQWRNKRVGSSAAGFGMAYGLSPNWRVHFVMSIIRHAEPRSANWETIDVAPVQELKGKGASGPKLGVFQTKDTIRYVLDPTKYAKYFPASGNYPGGVANKRIIEAVAAQEAFQRYIEWSDQFQGSVQVMATRKTITLRPQGHIDAILFSMSPDGKMVVSIEAPERRPRPDMLYLLPNSVLEALGRTLAYDGRYEQGASDGKAK